MCWKVGHWSQSLLILWWWSWRFQILFLVYSLTKSTHLEKCFCISLPKYHRHHAHHVPCIDFMDKGHYTWPCTCQIDCRLPMHVSHKDILAIETTNMFYCRYQLHMHSLTRFFCTNTFSTFLVHYTTSSSTLNSCKGIFFSHEYFWGNIPC